MIKVEFNKTVAISVPRQAIASLANLVQKELKTKSKNISLAFVDDSEIKKLNNRYRRKNKITDVLSFAMEDEENFGEIVIAVGQTKRQADSGLKYEILKLFLHGFLHLLGYDHEVLKQAIEMEKIEEKILTKFYARCK